jgi:hypothetical protein
MPSLPVPKASLYLAHGVMLKRVVDNRSMAVRQVLPAA